MTNRYLLPCTCGQAITVEPRHAGQEIGCRCGARVKVPTMLQMARLPRVEPPAGAERAASPWGVRQSIVLLGIAIVLGASVVAVMLLQTRPIPLPDRTDEIRQASENLTPVQAWRRWQLMRTHGLDRSQLEANDAYGEKMLRWWTKVGVVLLIAMAGIALIVTPLLMKRPWPRGNYSRST